MLDEVVAELERREGTTAAGVNRDSGWTGNATIAGLELASWFVRLWDEGFRQHCETVKAPLRRMYLDGDPRVKRTVEQGVIEHLFERPLKVKPN